MKTLEEELLLLFFSFPLKHSELKSFEFQHAARARRENYLASIQENSKGNWAFILALGLYQNGVVPEISNYRTWARAQLRSKLLIHFVIFFVVEMFLCSIITLQNQSSHLLSSFSFSHSIYENLPLFNFTKKIDCIYIHVNCHRQEKLQASKMPFWSYFLFLLSQLPILIPFCSRLTHWQWGPNKYFNWLRDMHG